MDKLLSISVAAYNVEKTLEKAIDTMVACKSLDFLEIIIVNDGSIDRTLCIAEKYKQKYPDSVVVIDKKNGGHGSTINAALKIAKGKYFKIIDGDDWVDTAELDKLINSIKQCDADLITTDFTMCLENSKKRILCHNGAGYKAQTIDMEMIIDQRAFQMHEITIKTNILRNSQCRILENCFYVDREFMQYCIGTAKTVCEFDYNVYCYRMGDVNQSVSPQNRAKRIGDQQKLLFRLLDWNKKCPIESRKSVLEKDTLKLIDYLIQSYSFFSMKNAKQAKKELSQLFRRIEREYPDFNLDKKYIFFWNYKDCPLLSKMFLIFKYVVSILNFRGFSFVVLLQKISVKG